MKPYIQHLLLTLALFTGTASYAGSDAGNDSARYYKNLPERFDEQAVDVDCTFVSRINGGPQVEGVAFFAAHTKDDENRARGGSIVVAVAADKADAFVRKYGSSIDIQRGATEKVDSKRLRGIFHQLEHGHVYIDTTDGDAHEKILANKEEAKAHIRSGDGIPGAKKRRL